MNITKHTKSLALAFVLLAAGCSSESASGTQWDASVLPEESIDAGAPERDGGDGGALSPASDCAKFVVSGDVASSAGAKWSYVSNDAGESFVLEGTLFAPAGAGPFPAVVVNHGKGGSPNSYSASVARVMRDWGMVVIAPRLTHAANQDGRGSTFLPAGGEGASEANVARVRKARDLLRCVNAADTTKVAVHGHSMGAFATAQTVGLTPSAFLAASHTAGGTSEGANATRPDAARAIRTPYQVHHGDQDTVVSIRQGEDLFGVLVMNGVPSEFYRYEGYAHETMALDPLMLDRVRAWYRTHGVLP
jgi:dienelactone hydrolase